ncbi:hypothetical protein [Altericroceibacterium endophyticum]|uniref:Uncharacterized protein n=1 Tax=Altericroceibacterium endophyticum TaxID=1808508 RepID=A0A6I4T5G4_9SPHN|nr:hypothetical protein [Altericroceibacterium endophyticum]MXO66444.1 hypothetical protein [Altericroceibacterium endophyticum]
MPAIGIPDWYTGRHERRVRQAASPFNAEIELDILCNPDDHRQDQLIAIAEGHTFSKLKAELTGSDQESRFGETVWQGLMRLRSKEKIPDADMEPHRG